MAVRKQWEGVVLTRLQEAEQFLQRLRDEDTDAGEALFVEWRVVTEQVLWFAYGEVSPHYRQFEQLAGLLTAGERGLCIQQLLACVQRARRTLQEQGIHNPLLHIEGIDQLPEYEQNKTYDQKAQREHFLWKMFWLSVWFGPFPI